jgi:hypothetical protein
MDRKAEPKKDTDKEKEAIQERQAYSHESILERLSIFDNAQFLLQAADYYVQKFGMLTAPLLALQQSPQATMVSHSHQVSKNEMIEAIGLLDLEGNEPGLYWIAQMMYLVPLPNFWSAKKVVKERNPQVVFQYKVCRNCLT